MYEEVGRGARRELAERIQTDKDKYRIEKWRFQAAGWKRLH
jgi:hypothetical protein